MALALGCVQTSVGVVDLRGDFSESIPGMILSPGTVSRVRGTWAQFCALWGRHGGDEWFRNWVAEQDAFVKSGKDDLVD